MNVRSFRDVVCALAGLGGISIIGMVLLAALGHEASPAVGALATCLATTVGVLVGIPIKPPDEPSQRDRGRAPDS